MKILPFTLESLSPTLPLDRSRLGSSVRPLSLAEVSQKPHGIVVVGFADETGIRNVGGRLGAKAGPTAIRTKLYKFTVTPPALPIYDLGDLQPAATIEATHAQATEIVQRLHEAGHFPIVLGGGHDLAFPQALGLLQANAKGPVTFCNIDAHLDLRPATEKITSGSPWYLLREHPLFQQSRSRIREFGIQRHCNAQALVDYATKHKISIDWLEDIRRKTTSADRQFQRLLATKGRLHVSLDIDSVNWAEAPGCSAPQTLGFRAEEVIAMSHAAGAAPRVESFGIFELSPSLDPDGRTAALAAHCVHACVEGWLARARKRNGRTPHRRLK